MGLDFSKLKGLAYRGFDDADAKAKKDDLVEQGFRVVDEPSPFDQGAKRPEAPAPKRQAAPFTSADGHSYQAMYRAAYDFHARHGAPTADDAYWAQTYDDMQATAAKFGDDPFLIGLLAEVYDELERAYKRGNSLAH